MRHPFTQLLVDSYSNLSRDIWLLSLVTLINRSGTMVIVFLTIYLTDELNFTLTQAGIAMSCFGIGSVAGSYIGGWLTDRIGYYPVMFWSLFINGVLLFFLMYVTTFYAFCAAVIILSTIGDSFRPANMASISAYSHPENHNRSLSLIRLAINLGFAVGAGAAGIISVHYGYSWLFIIDGVTCILGALFFLAVMKPKKEKISRAEKEIGALAGSSAYKDINYLIFVTAVFFNAVVFMQLFSSIPVYFKDVFELTKDEIGYVMVINGLVLVIFEMPLVYILEKRFKRMPLIIGGAILIGCSYLCFNLLALKVVILIHIIAISFGELINFPFSNAFALSRSNPARRGQFMGLYSMSFSIGFIIAPVLGMKVAETWDFTTLWYLMTAISIIATLGYVYVGKRVNQEVLVKDNVLTH